MEKLATDVQEDSWIEDYTAWGLASRDCELVIDPSSVDDVQPVGVIDIETDEADNFVGLGLAFEPSKVYYFTKLTVPLQYILTNTKLIGHNIKSDAQWLRKWQVPVEPTQLVGDTMLASYVQDSTRSSHALKDLAFSILGVKRPSYKDIVGTGKQKLTLDKHPTVLVANYCGCDVLDTLKLSQYFDKALSEEQRKYLSEIEIPCMQALMLMEERGVQVNVAYLRALDNQFNAEIQRLVEMVRRMAPPVENVNSDKQVGDFMVSKGFTLPKTPKGKNSVSVKALEPFEGVPFVKALRRYSELEKLTSTYTKPLIEKAGGEDSGSTYRLHANFNQAVTHTGRLSSSGPNLQNIPARTGTGSMLRHAFIARLGHIIIVVDYSQIEPRLYAHLSQDPELLLIFNKGLDLYDYVASVIRSTRSVAKTVWLALSYNAGAFTISQKAKISFGDAVKFVDKMEKRFKVAFKWKEDVMRHAECDKGVTTMYGRKIPLDDASLAPNYMIQGSAAEVMKLALIAVSEKFNCVLTVHDEIVAEVMGSEEYCPLTASQHIKQLMEGVVKLSVPLLVEIGCGVSWREAKD